MKETAVWSRRVIAALLPGLLFITSLARADWTLVPEASSVSFVSIKKGSVGEVHHFRSLAGGIDDANRVRLEIDLGSVDSGIPVRDERMREWLFETARFPKAVVTATLPDDSYRQMAAGDAADANLTVTLQLHGVSQTMQASLVVVALSADDLLVATRDPVIINAADFHLVRGIEKLREVANLPSIATAVPVNLVLLLHRRK